MNCKGNRLSRRGFLTVGALGGLGLTLADFLAARTAVADQKRYDFIEAKAESVIHIFLPGGIAHQETFDPKPYSPIEYRGEMGSLRTNTGEVISETLPQLAQIGRQVRDHSLDDARRGGPRTRHAQHVHRLQAQSRADLPLDGQRGQPRIRSPQQPAALRVHSRSAERICRQRLPEFLVRSVQSRCGSRRRWFSGARSEPAGRCE